MARVAGPARHDTPLIPAGAAFHGLVAFRGRARIDGRLADGEVVASGTLHVGPAAKVRARIEVDELVIEGSVEGELVAHRRLEVLGSGRVRGRLRTPGLALADGCTVDARCESGRVQTDAGAHSPAGEPTPPAPEPGASRRAAGDPEGGLGARPSSPESA